MPLLECSGLSKSFSGVPVLRGVSLAVEPGEVLGLVGENGAGKSTLMNIVGGVVPAGEGAMRWNGEPYQPREPRDATRRGIAFVHQELNLFPNLSITDNFFLSEYRGWMIDRAGAARRAREMLAQVDLDIDPATPVERLSQGERQLVEIARALGARARLIIFDEPTTSLGPADAERLLATVERLAASGLGVIYISHALEEVLRLCRNIVVLRDGEVAARGARGQFDRGRLIAAMIGRTIEQIYPSHPDRPPGEVVLEARRLSQPGIVHDISFALRRGEIVGISGLMGSGRSELARILFGLDPCARGEIELNGRRIERLSTRRRIRLGMAFVTESRRDDGLFLEEPVEPNLRIVFPMQAKLEALIAGLRLRCANTDRQPVKQLSGGNQQKVALGKWLVRQPEVLILDEPTRGIDVGARHEIYRAMNELAAAGVALLVISSELEELTGMCDRILVMRKGEIRAEFPCAEFRRERILEAAV